MTEKKELCFVVKKTYCISLTLDENEDMLTCSTDDDVECLEIDVGDSETGKEWDKMEDQEKLVDCLEEAIRIFHSDGPMHYYLRGESVRINPLAIGEILKQSGFSQVEPDCLFERVGMVVEVLGPNKKFCRVKWIGSSPALEVIWSDYLLPIG